MRRPVFVFLIFFSFTTCLLMTFAIYSAEMGKSPHFNGLFDALYFTVTTMTSVGYGDLVPVTRIGNVISMLTMIIGTGIYVTFTAALATVLIELEKNSPFS